MHDFFYFSARLVLSVPALETVGKRSHFLQIIRVFSVVVTPRPLFFFFFLVVPSDSP